MIDINDVGDRLFSRKTVDIIRAESELMPNNHKKMSAPDLARTRKKPFRLQAARPFTFQDTIFMSTAPL